MPTLASPHRVSPHLDSSITPLLMTLSSHASSWLWCWGLSEWWTSVLWRVPHGLSEGVMGHSSVVSPCRALDVSWALWLALASQSQLWLPALLVSSHCSDPGGVVIGSLSVKFGAWPDVRGVGQTGCCGVTYCCHDSDFSTVLAITVD